MDFSPRKGDLIVTARGPGVITKETKKYIYYFYGGHSLRCSKKRLQAAINSGDISIYRKKRIVGA